MTACITYEANSLDDTNKDGVKRSLIKTWTNEVILSLLLFSISRNILINYKQICPKVPLQKTVSTYATTFL